MNNSDRNSDDRRKQFARAAIVLVSAGTAASAGPEFARAVCDCSFSDILPTSNTEVVSGPSFQPLAGSYRWFATIRHDSLYGFESSVAPSFKIRLDTARMASYEFEGSVCADWYRWSYSGQSFSNGTDSCSAVTGAGGETVLTPSVTNMYGQDHHWADALQARVWTKNEAGTTITSDLINDDIHQAQFSLPACW